MGFRFRKSIKVGPARINLSKSGVGYSVGTKGLRVTKKAGGGTRTTASIPGTGISYSSDSKKRKTSTTKKTSAKSSSTAQTNSAQKNSGCLPAAGVLVVLALLVNWIQKYPVITILVLLLIAGGVFYLISKKKTKAAALSEPKHAAAETQAAEPEKPESQVKMYTVSGVNYRLSNLLSLMEPNDLYSYKKQELIDILYTDEPIYKLTTTTEAVELLPEPTNEHDPNAIKVMLGGNHVGYIPAKDCLEVLDCINSDKIIDISCEVEGGKYKMVVEDYDIAKDKSTYRMETGEDPYEITLYIRVKN